MGCSAPSGDARSSNQAFPKEEAAGGGLDPEATLGEDCQLPGSTDFWSWSRKEASLFLEGKDEQGTPLQAVGDPTACRLLEMPSRTNLAASIPSSKVKYSKLACTDEGYIDLQDGVQFKKSPPKIPYKAIALATVLFLIGTLLIIIVLQLALPCTVIAQGLLFQGTDRAIPILIIGILVFLPGFYHLRIAYFASKGYRGYSYDDIPDFDD
ncbi:hypothetical protein JD844_030946 [Phrynosoma platyrhinos]|uniref:Transmembrane protein 230 n=1 Tax=Phrynosoma platyrhinos TaxID=52577 RepID=A0ABQ7T0K7_PHRPL|nr:hypothetical protein JD844_030946 [Phrynosoma platyrhinos]